MREPEFWHKPAGLKAVALSPLGALYYGLGRLKRAMTRTQKMACPILCVGNATIGGAGKTPITDLLAGILAQSGYHPAILSRGYGGVLKGPLQVTGEHTAQEVGDEPCLLAQRHAVYVGADRRLSAAMACENAHDVLILDDGYQNTQLAYDLRILVIDGQRGFGNGGLIPAGPLREPWWVALSRADCVVVNQGQASQAVIDMCHKQKIPLFQATVTPKKSQPKPVYAYCGIANPDKFLRSLDDAGYEIKGTWVFDDHYDFSEIDARTLLGEASKRDAHLITTEKDAMRLRGRGGLHQALLSASEIFAIELVTTPDLGQFVRDQLAQR